MHHAPLGPTLNRRQLLRRGLASGAAVMALGYTGESALAAASPAANPEEAKLNALFERVMDETLTRSPETATSLGLDNGARLAAKGHLDDRSLEAWHADIQRNRADLAALRAIDRSRLTGLNRSNYDSVLFQVGLQDEANAKLPYYGSPYAVSQLTGAYQSVPDFLDSQHQIETAADAEAYLARLAAFGGALDQESEAVRHDVGLGVVPPDFILAKALVQMRNLRDAPPQGQNLVQSLVRRTAQKQIAGDWQQRAEAVLTAKVLPALDRQIALMESLQPKAGHQAGCGRLPGGGQEFYRLSLRQYTTADTAPEEIHRIGLALIAEQSAMMDQLMKQVGLTQGTIGERLRALFADPQYRYPNTDAGKDKLLADLNLLVEKVTALLPSYFGTLPKARLTIKRVPKFTEAGAPGGYYESGALDGSRPGAYYINLRDTAEVPRWTLPTLTFHEGIPGHHLQGSLAQEAGLPTLRKIQFFSGYGEGWALYAEQLAVEMGMYAQDPLGHIGQLHDSIFRAVRLVVDSGLHAMDWSREKAIEFYVNTIGNPVPVATTEVERYCVWPGQACSYMLGKLEWLRLREKAKAELGPRFDIRQFHDAGLLAGAMPLPVLSSRIGDYIASQRAS